MPIEIASRSLPASPPYVGKPSVSINKFLFLSAIPLLFVHKKPPIFEIPSFLALIVQPSAYENISLTIDSIEEFLPFEFIKLNHQPDGKFPNGIPNPLLKENRKITSDAVVKAGADLGIAWDGDFDRCFFFDENGQFIDNYYLIGMISKVLLELRHGANIIHDPRLIWNTREEVQSYAGNPIQSKAGHSFMKETMREHTAIYGGEMSGHHYFRDFYFSDSGMIPWLLVAEIMSQANQPLSELVSRFRNAARGIVPETENAPDETEIPRGGGISRSVRKSTNTRGARTLRLPRV